MKTAILLLFLGFGNLFAAEIVPLHKLAPEQLQVRLTNDIRSLEINRAGLQAVIKFVDSRPDIFRPTNSSAAPLTHREQKEVIWNTWQRFLDYMIALESLERYHSGFNRLKGDNREDSFFIGYSAMLARYRAALEFISHVDHNPEMDTILNDAVPELGLPSGTYEKIKFKYLNVAIATDFTAREVLMATFSGQRQPSLRKEIKSDADYIWESGHGRGPALTAKNALKVVQTSASRAWFPVQSGVAEWMGDVKVYRLDKSLISDTQVQALLRELQPGDVLLERREWYLSNVGLPGFWSHAALYIGTPAQRQSFFADPEVQAWVKSEGVASGDLEMLLKSRSPAAYNLGLEKDSNGHSIRIIEAISEGVSLTSLEHSAGCDSLAILRPRLPKKERARALACAFHYVGRPYDFDFDFSTDAQLVCTELVYKSYEPATGFKGLNFPITEVLGHKVTPANELARQFDNQYNTPNQQFDLVLFLDGQELKSKAAESTLIEFRQSWKRPKWHVLTAIFEGK